MGLSISECLFISILHWKFIIIRNASNEIHFHLQYSFVLRGKIQEIFSPCPSFFSSQLIQMNPEWAISDLSIWCAFTIIIIKLFSETSDKSNYIIALARDSHLFILRTFISKFILPISPLYEKWRGDNSIDLYKRMLQIQLSIYTLDDYRENNILLHWD